MAHDGVGNFVLVGKHRISLVNVRQLADLGGERDGEFSLCWKLVRKRVEVSCWRSFHVPRPTRTAEERRLCPVR